MAKRNKKELKKRKVMRRRAVISALAVAGVLGGVVGVNYLLGTNKADTSSAAPANDVSLVKSVNLTEACPGDTLKYQLVVNLNKGKSSGNLKVKDVLPSGLSYKKSISSGKKYNHKSGVWNVGKLKSKDKTSSSLTIVTKVKQGQNDQDIANSALISAGIKKDTNAANNGATVSTHIKSSDECSGKSEAKDKKDKGKKDKDKKNKKDKDKKDKNKQGNTATKDGSKEQGTPMASAPDFSNDQAVPSDGNTPADSPANNQGPATPSESLTPIANPVASNPDSGAPASQPATPTVNNPDSSTGVAPANQNKPTKKKIDYKKEADLKITKKVNKKQAGPQDNVVFTTIISNNGSDVAKDVVVRAAIPDGTSYKAYKSTKGIYSATSGDWVVGELAANEQVELAVTANLANVPVGQTVTDQATITSSSTLVQDADSENNSGSSEVKVTNTTRQPKVAQSVQSIGDNMQAWTIILSNPGNDKTINASFFDPIPANSSYVADSLSCQTSGSSVEETCLFDPVKSQIAWGGTLASSGGISSIGSSDNSVTILFKTESAKAGLQVANIPCINWDYNDNGSISDELSDQQNPNCLVPLVVGNHAEKKKNILVGVLYGLALGLFFSWLIYLLRKKSTKKTGQKSAQKATRKKGGRAIKKSKPRK